MEYFTKILVPIVLISMMHCNYYKENNFDLKSIDRNASHKIINPIILKPIKNAIERELKNNSILDVILIRIDSLSDTKQNVFTKTSNFRTELIFHKQRNKKNNLKGFLWVDNVLVLLYNEPGYFFEKINSTIDVFEKEKNKSVLVNIHTPYYFYQYEKYKVLDETIESINLKGELDKIDD